MNTVLRAVLRGTVYRLLPRNKTTLVVVGLIALVALIAANGAKAEIGRACTDHTGGTAESTSTPLDLGAATEVSGFVTVNAVSTTAADPTTVFGRIVIEVSDGAGVYWEADGSGIYDTDAWGETYPRQVTTLENVELQGAAGGLVRIRVLDDTANGSGPEGVDVTAACLVLAWGTPTVAISQAGTDNDVDSSGGGGSSGGTVTLSDEDRQTAATAAEASWLIAGLIALAFFAGFVRFGLARV